MTDDLKEMYKTIADEHFPSQMEISFVEGNQRQTLFYEKVLWDIGGESKACATVKIRGRKLRFTSWSTAM